MLSFKSRPDFLDNYSVIGFEVNQLLGEVGSLEIFLKSRKASSSSDFSDHVKLQSVLGKSLEIERDGWGFVGVVEQVEFEGQRGYFRLTLKDALSTLSHIHGSAVFVDKTIEEITSEVLPNGQSCSFLGELGSCKVTLAIQYQESSLNFLKRLVNLHGGQIWCNNGEIILGNIAGPQTVNLRLGHDVLSYTFGTRLGVDSVNMKSVSYANNNDISVSNIELEDSGYGDIQDSSSKSRGQLKDNSSFHIIHEDDSANDLKGVGENILRTQAAGRFFFSGETKQAVPLGAKLILESAALDDDSAKEESVVRVVRGMSPPDPDNDDVSWYIEAANPQALLGLSDVPSNSLFTSSAIVMQAGDSTNRATVFFPWDKTQEETPLLRIISPSWGAEHMQYMPPNPGDSVLVQWGQWDMDPIIIGSVSVGDEVETPEESFVLQTVDGHKITVGSESITVLNSSGTKMEIAPDSVLVETSDGHELELGPQAISLKHSSGGTFEITSSAIVMKSSGDVEISSSAGASIKLSGPKVVINDGGLEVI